TRGVVGGSGGGDLGAARYCGDCDLPPGAAGGGAEGGVGGDDDHGCAQLGPGRHQRSVEFGEAGHLARSGAEARAVGGEIDPRAVRKQVVETGAAAAALQPIDAAEPAIVQDDDVEL